MSTSDESDGEEEFKKLEEEEKRRHEKAMQSIKEKIEKKRNKKKNEHRSIHLDEDEDLSTSSPLPAKENGIKLDESFLGQIIIEDVSEDESSTSEPDVKKKNRFQKKQDEKARKQEKFVANTPKGDEYLRTLSQCDIAGPLYEIKVSALLYLRAVTRKLNFLLASNVEAAGLYDDITLAYETESGRKQMLVQLKHKDSSSILKTHLLAKDTSKTGFSLLECYKSFCDLQINFPNNKELNKYSEFKDIDFILCTNAPAVSSGGVFIDADICKCDDSILRMCGKVFSFAQNQQLIDEFKVKYSNEVDDVIVTQFFKQFYIYSDQSNERELDAEINNEMMSLYNISNHGAVRNSHTFVKQIENWWRDRARTRVRLKYDTFSFKSGPEILAELNAEPKILKFESEITAKIKKILSTDLQIVNCTTKIYMCDPSLDMVQQSIPDTAKCLTMSLENIESSREDILHVWPSNWCQILIVYDTGYTVNSKSLRRISVMITELLNQCKVAKIVLISKQGNLLKTLFPDCLKSSYKEVDVTCEMKNLTKESKEVVLKKEIIFQGSDVNANVQVTVQSVLGENCVHAVDAHLLSRLAYDDGKVHMGSLKKENIKFYIDRVLTRNSFVDKSILTSHSRCIIAISGVSEGQMQTMLLGKHNESNTPLLHPKPFISIQISLPQENMMHWYSDGSILDPTLAAANPIISSLFKQMSELNRTDKPNSIQSETNQFCSDISLERKRFTIINSTEDFAMLCKKHKHRNVHWLSVQEGKLKWIKSGGKLNTIKHYLSEEKERCHVSNVWDIPDRIVILTADSGMGKTTLLQQIALNSKYIKPDVCIIQINLIDCQADLERLEQKITKEKACEFLIRNGMQFTENFQSSDFTFFKSILIEANSAVVLVDGFDEVCPENEQNALNLIASICKLRISKLWISSRHGATSGLERITKIIPFELQPLSMLDCELLVSHFVNSVEQIPHTETTALLNHIYSRFTGNPLHCKMFTEILNNRNNSENDFFENMNKITYLTFMEEIVETKFKIYCKKYINFKIETQHTQDIIKSKRKNFINNHQLSAVLQISSVPMKYYMKNIEKKEFDDFKEKVKTSSEKTGIISTFRGGMPQFEHKIYEEYFLALWMAENCSGPHRKITQNILKNIIFNPQFMNTVNFFNGMTAKGSELHTAILNNDWISSFPEMLKLDYVPLVNKVDNAGRTVLHLALSLWSSSRDNIHVSLITIPKQMEMIRRLIFFGAKLTLKDKLLKWSPFQYSNIQTVPWSIVVIMMDHGGVGSQDYQELIRRVELEKRGALEGLAYGVSIGSTTLLSFLLENGINVNNGVNEMEDTALIIAAGFGKFDVLKYLRNEWHADPHIKNKNGDSPLHWACLRGHLSIVTYLISECQVAKDIKNKTGYTPLLAAARGGHLPIVEYLKENCKCSFKERTNFEQSALNLAAGYARDDPGLVEYFVETCKLDIKERDHFGLFPVTAACVYGKFNIVKFFVEKCGLDPLMDFGSRFTLLHCVCIHLPLQQVKEYVACYNLSLDITDSEGITLFTWASVFGRFDMCEHMRNVCTNVKAVSKSNNSALHYFIINCRMVVETKWVKWLIETCEIDPNIVNCSGFTALHFAVQRANNPKTKLSIEPSAVEYLQKVTTVKTSVVTRKQSLQV